jgi:lipoyl-dependent peroxiredoxin
MPEFQRHGSASWRGDLRSGSGTASSESGVLTDAKMAYVSRFENTPGSNPEELIAAAHASCFSMAFANILAQGGNAPDEIRTKATVTLRTGEGGARITKVHLDTEASVPGIDEAAFQKAAEGAKANCPVSKLLTPGLEEVSLSAKLVR